MEFLKLNCFSKYLFTKDGRVLHIKKNRYLQGSKNNQGYFNYRLTDDSGHVSTVGRYRVLALLHLRCPGSPSEYVVNHKNGIKDDDRVDNLEWVTFQENIHHAGEYGLPPKCLPISVKDVDTGIIQEFPSMVACARELGFSKDAIAYRLKVGSGRVFPERKQYKFKYEDWIEIKSIEKALLKNGANKRILTKDILSGEIRSFETMSDLAAELTVALSTVSVWMTKFNQPVVNGFYQLKWESNDDDWLEHSDPFETYEKVTGKRVVQVLDEVGDLLYIYQSLVECALAHKLRINTLHFRLKSNGNKIYPDGLRYKYRETLCPLQV